MQETLNENIPLSERLTPPDYNQHFQSLVDLSPNYGKKPDKMWARVLSIFGAEDPELTKDRLDRISTFWQEYEKHVDVALRLEHAISLPGIPDGEKRAAKAYLDDYVAALEPAILALQAFVKAKPEERTWEDNCLPISQAIIDFKDADCGYYEESIIALLEAISNHPKRLDASAIMRKIAQNAIIEIWETVNYYQLTQQVEYESDDEEDVLELGDTTLDDLEMEKNEFVAGLNKKNWNEKTLKDNRKALLRLKRAMDDEDFTDEVKLIWAAVQGKTKRIILEDDSTRKSNAIDVVIAAEEIFQSLKSEGVIDWEPDEEESDEDDDMDDPEDE